MPPKKKRTGKGSLELDMDGLDLIDNPDGPEDPMFEVEKIVKKKISNGEPLYLIKWKNYPDSQNTWEPSDNLQTIQELIDKFEGKILKGGPAEERGTKKIMKQSKKKVTTLSHRGRRKAIPKKTQSLKVSPPEDSSIKHDLTGGDSRTEIPTQTMLVAVEPGSFEASDVPLRISEFSFIGEANGAWKAGLEDARFKVEWAKRPDGTKPEATYYSAAELRKFAPLTLLDFYEQRITFLWDQPNAA